MADDLAKHAASNRNAVTLVPTLHGEQYPAIDPHRPELSAKGKAIIISGGATGIGYAIARNFAIAGASYVVLLARRAETLEKASAELSRAYPGTVFLTYAVSITDETAVTKTFEEILTKTGSLDVLATSAAFFAPLGHKAIEIAADDIRSSFETNVIGNLNLVRAFVSDLATYPTNRQKVILEISPAAAHNYFPTIAAYGASKLAFTHMMRYFQAEYPQVRVHSFHPGSIFSPAAQRVTGVTKGAFPWDDEDLPGGFAVWLASEEAAFTKGKFLHSAWDVGDVKARKQELEESPELAIIGIKI